MTNIEKRLMNTEMAMVAMWALLKPLQPPSTQEDIDHMMSEYFDANMELGSAMPSDPNFIRE